MLIDFFKYFFREQPDGYIFPSFSKTHYVILGITILICYLMVRYRWEIRKNDKLRNGIKNTVIIVLLSQQIFLYIWYWKSQYNFLTQGLPLYNCRVAIIATALGLVFNNKMLKTISCYWGILGGIVALLCPIVDPFTFPHYTVVSFFIGHVFLMVGCLYIIVIEQYNFNLNSLISILKFSTIYNVVVFFINRILNSNYCFLNMAPFSLEREIPQLVYTLIVFMVFNMAIWIEHMLTKNIQAKMEIKDNIKYNG